LVILKALALIALILVPGWLAVSLIHGGEEGLDIHERLFLTAVLGSGIAAVSALALALASVYSLYSLLILVGALCVLMAVAARGKVLWPREVGLKALLLALAVIIAALVLFSPPSPTVFGWSDVGVYPNIAAHIEREGGVALEVSTVKEVGPQRRELVYKPSSDPSNPYQAYENKAFFITDFDSGEVVPQFYYLWPALMAVFASFLGLGLQFWAVTAMGLLALWGFLLLARRLMDWRWGLAAAVLAALSPLLLYFARYATTEMMNMALFVSGSLCLTAYLQAEKGGEKGGVKGLAVTAALLFTLGFLCRIDFVVILIPLGLCYLGKRVFARLSSADWWFCGLLFTGAVIASLIGWIFSAPYIHNIWSSVLNIRWSILLIIGAVLILAVLAFIFARRLKPAALWLAKHRNLYMSLLWLALGAWFIYLYFLRPQGVDPLIEYGVINPILGPSYNIETLVRWAWYFSFLGALLVFAGYALWFTRKRRFAEVPVVMMGFIFTLVFSWSLRCTPLHILAMRRLIPVVFPIAMLVIVFVLKSLVDMTNKAPERLAGIAKVFAAGLLLYFILFSVNASLPIIGLEEGGNQLELCGDIAQDVEEDGVVLMDYNLGDLFGPPLRCFYGIENAWILDNSIIEGGEFSRLLEDLGFPDRAIYLLWRPGMSGAEVSSDDGIEISTAGDYISWEDMLEKSFTHRPSRREYLSEEVWLLRLEAE